MKSAVSGICWFLGMVCILLHTQTSWSQQNWGQQFASGRPHQENVTLSSSTLVELPLTALKNPSVLWFDEEYFKGQFPPDFKRSDVQNELIKQFAYARPSSAEDEAGYQSNIKKTFYVDYYGGTGNNDNLGSGRAAITGKFQVKGTGRTLMVNHSRADHSDGLLSLDHGLREILWSKILEDIPIPRAKVVALIDRGILDPLTGKKTVLVVREAPTRIAHFIPTLNISGTEKVRDDKRIAESFQYLDRALGVNDLRHNDFDFNSSKRIEALHQLFGRIAKFYAALYGRNFYHGQTSPSNFEIDGSLIDLNSLTATLGFLRLRLAPRFEDAAFEMNMTAKILVVQFLDTLKAQPQIKAWAALPPNEVFSSKFRAVYEKAYQFEMLRLTGVPLFILEQLKDTPEAQSLAKTLSEFSLRGSKETFYGMGLPKLAGEIDLHSLLVKIGEQPFDFHLMVSHRSLELLPKFADRSSFATQYASFMKLVNNLAVQEGVAPGHLVFFIQKNSVRLNRMLPQLSGKYSLNPPDAPEDFTAWVESFLAKNSIHTPFRPVLDNRESIEKIFEADVSEVPVRNWRDRLSGVSWISDCRHIMLGKLLPKDRPHAKWVQKIVK